MRYELLHFVQRITSNGIFYLYSLLKLFSKFSIALSLYSIHVGMFLKFVFTIFLILKTVLNLKQMLFKNIFRLVINKDMYTLLLPH